MNNLKYMIFDYSNVTDELMAASLETSRETLRRTVSGTDKALLKYNYDLGTHSVFEGETTYTQEEIGPILGTSVWSKSFP